ncbi:MAG: hypothetical protein AABY78_02060 [Nitrospirota bacterium]
MKVYDIYLPLRYNDDREIEPSKFDQTRKELIDRFGGLSVLPSQGATIEGWWRFKEEIVRDEIRIFRVFTGSEDDDFWKKYKTILKDRFQQEEIFILSYDVSII